MKSYTDLEQSRKLAEILPLESADMSYRPYRAEGGIPDHETTLLPFRYASWIGVPCWSLVALLEVLPKNYGRYTKSLYWFDDGWHCEYVDQDGEGYVGETADNPIDACCNTILKLKELKLL